MTIDIPELDDKSYEELVEEATQRLPAYEDGWTDYNPSDPGIAILELLAYLTDTYTYQLDTITDDHRRKYLKLMGERPQPPEPATVQLSLSVPAGADRTRVPAGTKLTMIDTGEGEAVFETDDDVELIDARIAGIVTEHGEGRVDHTQANEKEGMFYRAFGPRAAPGNAMYLGFDGDPFAGVDSLAITVDFHDEDLPPLASHGDEAPRFFPSVDVGWEYCTDYENADRFDAWEPLSVTRDGTYAFYRGGRVRLQRPDGWTPDGWSLGEGIRGGEDGLFWLRCRVLEGSYEIPPQINSVRLHVVAASHRSTVEDEQLRRANAGDDPAALTEQVYEFPHAPVLSAEVSVDGVTWTEVSDFDASGPTDPHYVLDRAAGTVRFGDGVAGRMPDPDATVVAQQYAFGGGREGNVPATASWRFLNPDRAVGDDLTLGDVAITAESAGTGGADGESLAEAFRRTRRDLRTPYRAVTEDDYRYVATHTPGLRFGRATVRVEEVTDLDVAGSPTAVRVVVVPYAPLSTARPEPSEGFLDAVERHIEKFRLLSDRVRVEGPQYVGLSVEVSVQTSAWLPESRVTRAVESELAEFVHPIHGYEGDGWPFGRPLYSGAVRDRLSSIDFVDHVRELSIRSHGPARVDGDGNVLPDDAALLALNSVETDVRTVTTDRNGEGE